MTTFNTFSPGMVDPSTPWGVYNNLLFVVRQAINKIQTASIVQVNACSNAGDTSPVGTVDVTILVNQINGLGNPTPHLKMIGLPYLRIQGGANAVILDPQPGDIGIAIFSSRDITKVKATKAQANPGSFRTYDFSDGMYVGGLLNGSPSQYVQFSASGIQVTSPTAITLTAPQITLHGPVTQDSGSVTMAETLTVTGDVTGSGTSLHTHLHSGVQVGGAETGPPV